MGQDKSPSQELRESFETTALPYTDAVYNKAYRLTQNREEARDLVQETFLRAYRTFSNFTPGTNCRAWLFKITYSIFVNRYRKVQRQPQQVSMDELEEKFHVALADLKHDGREDVLNSFDWKELEVDKALGSLSEEFRSTILLVDVEGLTYDEAADVLECPVGTVRSRLFRARKELFVSLAEYARGKGYLAKTET